MKNISVFISHSWSYDEHRAKIIKFLDDRSYFSFKDLSIPKNSPIHNANTTKELYDEIEKRMKEADIIVIPAGVYASYSEWINNEIQIAQRYSIPILAVSPWGQERLSTTVTKAANTIVGWTTESIVNGIRYLVETNG